MSQFKRWYSSDVVKILLLFLAAGGVALAGLGASEAGEQHRLIRTAVPVEATILSTELASRGREEFQPIVRFKYKVGETHRQGQKVYPVTDSGSLNWAREAIDPYEANQQVQAYYDPADVGNAFLRREYQFGSYSIVLMGMGMAVGSAYLFWHAVRTDRRKARPPTAVEGWFVMESPDTLPGTARRFIILAFTCFVCGGLVFSHYAWNTGQWWNDQSSIALVVWLVISALLLIAGLYPLVVARHLSDAVVLVDKPAYEFGDRIAICVQQVVKRPCRVRDMMLEVRCMQVVHSMFKMGTVQPEQIVWKATKSTLEGYEVTQPETLQAEFTLEIPLNGPPPPPKNPPFRRISYEWRLYQRTRIRGVPPCPDLFQLRVSPSSEADVILAEVDEAAPGNGEITRGLPGCANPN